MGIKGLTSILKKFAPHSIQQVKLGTLYNKKIAIDTSLFIHKFLYSYSNIIHGFFLQIYHLRRRHIEPVYIFDGKPPKEKKNVIEQRKNNQIKITNRITNLELQLKTLNEGKSISTLATTSPTGIDLVTDDTTQEEKEPTPEEIEKQKKEITMKMKSLSRQIFKLTSDDFRKLKTLFNLLNIGYYEAHGEADILCVKLEKERVVDACMTEDMDFLTHGSNYLIRDFHNKSNVVNVYKLENILHDLNMSKNQFIDMCILCGCDYSSKIKGLGAIGSYNFIKKYGNIETFIENECKENGRYCLDERFDYTKSRELFDASNREFSYTFHQNKEINLNTLNAFLLEHTKLTDKQIKNKFKKLY